MPTLRETSRLEGPRAQQIFGWLLQYSPFMAALEARSAFRLGATSFDTYPSDSTGAVQTRALGDGYTQNGELPPARQGQSLGFHGDSVTVDRSHVVDDELGLRPIGSWLDRQLHIKVRLWARGMETLVFKGSGVKDASGREMLGLENILDGTTVAGFSQSFVIDATDALSTNPDSLDLGDPAQQEAFIRMMEEILPEFMDPMIAANKQLGATLGTIARKRQQYERIQGAFDEMIEQTFDAQLTRVANGAITNNEPDNAGTPNTNTTSLYVMSAADGMYSIATNSGLEVEDEIDEVLEDKRSGKVEFELRSENVIEDRYAIRRIRNVKLPTGQGSYID